MPKPKAKTGRLTISFRLPSETRKRLDDVAAQLDRDRSYVINEALDRYLEVYAWQEAHIREGLTQAQSGQLGPHQEVVNKWEARLAQAELDASG